MELDVLSMQVNQLGREYHLGKSVSEDLCFLLINDIREKEEYTCSGHVPEGVIQRTANKFKFSRFRIQNTCLIPTLLGPNYTTPGGGGYSNIFHTGVCGPNLNCLPIYKVCDSQI